MSDKKRNLSKESASKDVDAFLAKVASMPVAWSTPGSGRLLFAMDATASREPTWDQACSLQSEMFIAAAEQGGLEVELVFYRGFNDFQATGWVGDSRALSRSMECVRCAGGQTQIERVLRHAAHEARRSRVDALVFVGDCMEESVDTLCQLAGELGLQGVPAFIFQEGSDTIAEQTFKQMARLSGGAWSRFDAGSPDQLRALLRAVAVFAAGGRSALKRLAHEERGLARQLAHQIDLTKNS